MCVMFMRVSVCLMARGRVAALTLHLVPYSTEDDVELNLFHSFAATCFYFAKSLTDEFSAHNQTAPPIGLIATAVGGSQIEAWMPEDSLNECAGTSLNTDGVAPPTKLYNGMVAPFVNMSIKGFLWYQGEVSTELQLLIEHRRARCSLVHRPRTLLLLLPPRHLMKRPPVPSSPNPRTTAVETWVTR